ncbi:MAG: hypothetical protein R2711_03730 [Acidimicrobiales bacterium]
MVACALAPALQRTNLSAFHPEAMALPALMAAYLRARQEQWVRYGLLAGIVLIARGRPRAHPGGAGPPRGPRRAPPGRRHHLGGRHRLDGGRGRGRLARPARRPPDPAEEFVARATGPLAVVPRLLADPIQLGRQLFAEPSVLFLVVVLAPLLFLRWSRRAGVAAAAPAMALAMIADTLVQEAAERGVVNLRRPPPTSLPPSHSSSWP